MPPENAVGHTVIELARIGELRIDGDVVGRAVVVKADGERPIAVIGKHVLNRGWLAEGHFGQSGQERAIADHALIDVGVLRSPFAEQGYR